MPALSLSGAGKHMEEDMSPQMLILTAALTGLAVTAALSDWTQEAARTLRHGIVAAEGTEAKHITNPHFKE